MTVEKYFKAICQKCNHPEPTISFVSKSHGTHSHIANLINCSVRSYRISSKYLKCYQQNEFIHKWTDNVVIVIFTVNT